MNEKETIKNFLSIEQPMPLLMSHTSTIALLLKGARKMFGCNLNTGKYERFEFTKERLEDETLHSFQFSGLINYLIFLEQIGAALKPKNITKHTKRNEIFRCLKYFSNISSDEAKINVIVALRNSLVHRFGLATKKSLKPNPRKFILSSERNSEVVGFPENEWNGDFSIKLDSCSTTIYIIDLVELIENTYQKVLEEVENDNIEITLADGIQELKARYSITH